MTEDTAGGGTTVALVESPVQLLNVLEWAYQGGTVIPLTVVVLPPTEPLSRGQLRRMAELAMDDGLEVRWQEARGGAGPLRTMTSLARPLRRARRVVLGDPFSRYVQTLLTIVKAREVVVVDDGTATMEFTAQLARGERFVRWHRSGRGGGARGMLFAPVASAARRRLTPAGGAGAAGTRVEVFTSMPVVDPPEGLKVTANEFAWTRSRFGPPSVGAATDLVGTSLVETGVVDHDRYLEAVASLTKVYGATRYFAHRRERADKLHRLHQHTGLEIVRPDLPLEIIARRGPIGRTIVSFPSTVVHTLPLALAGTGVKVAVCEVDASWLTETASPRAQGFLSSVAGAARERRGVDGLPVGPATATGWSGAPAASV
ncbi:hypothetical protein [Streptomyces aculeolatus]|uniref:hypothetical protein n=1 Tax=Streptomyces aculeolatus TaxID=270689 RepID=UPI001CEDE42C|nr:hypothetical protein [Streptomyces aculeolatus]